MRLLLPLALVVLVSGCICCGGGDDGLSLDSILGGLRDSTTTTTTYYVTTTSPPTTLAPTTTTSSTTTSTSTTTTSSTTTTTISNVTCFSSEDCGESTVEYYCYHDAVYKRTLIPICKNAGSEQSSCIFKITGGHAAGVTGQPLPPEESCTGSKRCVETGENTAECQ